MTDSPTADPRVADMPRGGPDASWLDRRLQTNALEYTDRYDVPDELKQRVINGLDSVGTRRGEHETNARTVLSLVAEVPNPRILELAAGHGQLSSKILALHPTATVTVSDLDPTSVAKMGAGPLGSHPRASTKVVDATAIDAEADSYDVVVMALALHHLPPATAYRVIADATRVGRRFVVIDLKRMPSVGLLVYPVFALPFLALMMPRSSWWPVLHDGFISGLRAYSPSAFTALGKAVDPDMSIEFMRRPWRLGPTPATVVYSRPQTGSAIADVKR